MKVHDLPDFVYFNHSIHVAKGVGCETCHGRVDKMPLMWQEASLQMEWCLECHRAPEKHLRPLEEVYNFEYNAETYISNNPQLGVKTTKDLGLKLKEQFDVKPKESCATCHH